MDSVGLREIYKTQNERLVLKKDLPRLFADELDDLNIIAVYPDKYSSLNGMCYYLLLKQSDGNIKAVTIKIDNNDLYISSVYVDLLLYNFRIAPNKVNQQINISGLNKPTKHYYFNKGKLCFSQVNTFNSKLQSWRDNPDVLFIFDKNSNTIHDKTCKKLDSIPINQLEVFEGLLFDINFCNECRAQLHIRLICGDDFKHYNAYQRFFKEGNLSQKEIEEYVRDRDFHMKFIDKDIMQIKVNEDTWRIEKYNDLYYLYHNNYSLDCVEQRYIPDDMFKDYHLQSVNKSLRKLLDKICSYSWDLSHHKEFRDAGYVPETSYDPGINIYNNIWF